MVLSHSNLRGLIALLVLVLSMSSIFQAQIPTRPQKGTGVNLSYIDTTVNPCEDFYQYANGVWLNNAEIPSDRASWGSGSELVERNLVLIHKILEDATNDKSAPAGSVTWKVGSFYRSGMDSALIESQGLSPLQGEFNRISDMKNLNDLMGEIGHLHRIGVPAAFSFYVYMDFKNASENIPQFYQGGLGLPNREYYTKTDSGSVELKKKYVLYVGRMFELMGDKESASEAEIVLSIENRLAKASITPVEERDPNGVYHKLHRSDLDTLAKGIPWDTYFSALKFSNADGINVGQLHFFNELGVMLTILPLDDWKTYLRWQLINTEAPRLSSAFVKENFNFNGTIIRGTKMLQARWKSIYQSVDQELGEALGQLFVEKAFGPAAKKRATEMVVNLKAALRDRLTTLEWISEKTRQQALKKIDAMAIKIGYPDRWRDYSTLAIDGTSFVENAIQADEFEFQRNLNKIGKPLDRTEWGMTPTTVNAYYNPNYNEIVFPAGILQPPFFDMDGDDATMYGAIGSIIGHEITHGFDDRGSQFDAAGNLDDWWTADDRKNYNSRSELIVEQYDNYIAVDTNHINGKLTLGENIADLGGVKISYLAYMKSLKGEEHPAPIDGYTAEQRFFLAYAQAWKRLSHPETIKLMILNDGHSPAKFRVLGPLTNIEEFGKAFKCTIGTMVNKTKKAEIW